jgi:hypothetical protein
MAVGSAVKLSNMTAQTSRIEQVAQQQLPVWLEPALLWATVIASVATLVAMVLLALPAACWQAPQAL